MNFQVSYSGFKKGFQEPLIEYAKHCFCMYYTACVYCWIHFSDVANDVCWTWAISHTDNSSKNKSESTKAQAEPAPETTAAQEKLALDANKEQICCL
jgi:hypothetical protein